MGWGRTLLLGDIGNRMDIEDTERDIKNLRERLTRSTKRDISKDKKIDILLNESAELKLYIAALVRLLTSKGTISSEELRKIVEAIDAEDGISDGKYSGDIV